MNGFDSHNADKDEDQNTNISYGPLGHTVGIWNYEHLLTLFHCLLATYMNHLQLQVKDSSEQN